MSEVEAPVRARGSRRGRAGRRAGEQSTTVSAPYITRNIPYYEVLDEEGLSLTPSLFRLTAAPLSTTWIKADATPPSKISRTL